MKLELKVDPRELWKAYAERIYPGNKLIKSVTELLQNSVDASATMVEIEVKETAAKQWELMFSDNGCGMTTDIFANKFLCLGASDPKENHGSGKVGGNGVAKAIILFNKFVADFAIESCSADGRRFMVTQDEILGEADFSEEPVKVKESGVRYFIKYDFNQDEHHEYDHLASFTELLRAVLGYAITPQTLVMLNGIEVLSPLKPSPKLSEMVGYPVYEDTKPPFRLCGHFYVLSNGLPQYAQYGAYYLNYAYVLNLTPSTYRDFTPAREAVNNSAMMNAVQALRQRMAFEAENPLSAKKTLDRKAKKRVEYNYWGETTNALASDELKKLVPNRGVVVEDHETGGDWHPEQEVFGRRVLALVDRYISFFESEYTDLRVRNIGFARGDGNNGSFNKTKSELLINPLNFCGVWEWTARAILFLLTHELSHFWFESHTEQFALRQAELLDTAAEFWDEFNDIRQAVETEIT